MNATLEDRPVSRHPWSEASSSELSAALRTALLLDDSPVGVRIISEGAELLEVPIGPPERPLFFCEAVARASEEKASVLRMSDISCDTALRVLGLEPGFCDDDFLESYVSGGLYDEMAVADSVLADVPVLARTVGLIVAPLSRFDALDPPHVVVVSTTAYGAMRIAQASAFHGHISHCAPIGMHSICAECTAGPHRSGAVCVSLLCSSARYAAGWDEDRLAVGVPFDVLRDVVDGLLATMQRYETDERKARIRSACERAHSCSAILLERIAELRDGTSYFASRGPNGACTAQSPPPPSPQDPI